MTRALLIGLAVLAAAGAAQAQVYGAPGASGFGGGGYSGGGGNPLAGLNSSFAPNFFNRSQQPLSPYLNLLRGGNPAVNYFYGVRPGLSPGVSGVGGGFAPANAGLGPPGTGNRFYLQPSQLQDELPSQPLDAAQPRPNNLILSAAHPVVFNARPALAGGFRGAQRTGFGAQPPASTRPSPSAGRR
jgi:hypothetical protein